MAPRSRSEVVRSDRAGTGHLTVETQLIAEPDTETEGGAGHMTRHHPHELAKTRFVNHRHGYLLRHANAAIEALRG